MLGKLSVDKNDNREINSSLFYNKVLILNSDGSYETLLITDNELSRIRERSRKNLDEQLEPSLLDRAFAFVTVMASNLLR